MRGRSSGFAAAHVHHRVAGGTRSRARVQSQPAAARIDRHATWPWHAPAGRCRRGSLAPQRMHAHRVTRALRLPARAHPRATACSLGPLSAGPRVSPAATSPSCSPSKCLRNVRERTTNASAAHRGTPAKTSPAARTIAPERMKAVRRTLRTPRQPPADYCRIPSQRQRVRTQTSPEKESPATCRLCRARA